LKIDELISRLKIYFKTETDKELAQYLGVSATNLSNWKKRNTFDFDVVFTKCEGVNFNWLFLGEGDTLRDKAPPGEKIEIPTDSLLINALRENIETQRRYISFLENRVSEMTALYEPESRPEQHGQKRKAG
jgi:hypothetical protein